jgi:hypothetical protein
MPTNSSKPKDSPAPDIVYTRRPGIAVRRLVDTIFLADQDNDALFSLNEIGSAVWTLLEEPQSTQQIVQVLLEAFPGSDEKLVRQDIKKLVLSLQRRNLIMPA